MKRHILFFQALLIGLALASNGLWAQLPSGYYDAAADKSGDALKAALHDIVKGHHVVSYGALLNAFAYTDCDANGKIWDMYSNCHYDLDGNCGSYEQEGDCWNREHTWPQSWFNSENGPRSDLFHIYPTDGYVNAQRSNYPYGEVIHPTYTSGNGSKLGPCATTGYSGTVFEPIDEYKGDIARSYFYMSVRYAGEDDGWGNSGMTTKADIKDWAMAMLLRWNDDDPVSQKEIDRNNVVYGYQNNRNPFIDHPEYARMIWDPTWTQGTAYAITCATGLAHGSLNAPETAIEGSTVAIMAVPDAGYMGDSWNVCKADDPTTTLSVSQNGTFTMPGFDVTVSATFAPNNTYYAIATGATLHGSISLSASSALSGTVVGLSALPEAGYGLYAWYVFKQGDMSLTVPVTNGSFVMPAFDVTVMATFVLNRDYVKVTTAPADWSGEYLIVNEAGGKAFNGGLSALDAVNNVIPVTITEQTIASTTATDAARFTMTKSGAGYTIMSASGYYIGQNTDANGLQASQTTTYINTISLSGSDAEVVGTAGAHLRYNATASQNRFRYFKSTTYTNQQPVQLYKKSGSNATPTHSINFHPNGGGGMMESQTVNEFEPTALMGNTFANEGFLFDGWNTEADGSGDYYLDGAMITLLADVDLYAQWEPLYSVTILGTPHGSVGADAGQAIAEATVSLTACPDNCYALQQWVVTDAMGHGVNVSENQFEMPASDVTVLALFGYAPQAFVQEYQLVTSTDALVPGRHYLIVNNANAKALGTVQNANNRSAVAVTIEGDVIPSIDNTVCELVLGSEDGLWTFFDAGYGSSGGYLYAASSSSNYLRTQAVNNANGQWSIAIADGVATLTAQGNNSRNLLRYNQQSDIFSCYGFGQMEVSLYRRTEVYDYPAEQTVTLNQGWNWFSTNVEITLDELKSALVAALPGTVITIKSQNANTVYNGSSWRGQMSSLDVTQMYDIQAAAGCEFVLSGMPVNPAENPATIHHGANWIAFPLSEAMALDEAFAGFAVDDDIVKSQLGSSAYIGNHWRGSVTNLMPGKGYIYKSSATTTKTFSFPDRYGKK